MKKITLCLIISIFYLFSFAQNKISCFVKDAITKDNLQGVSANILGTSLSTASTKNGNINFSNLSSGKIKIIFSSIGYQSKTIEFIIPQGDTIQIIYLQKADQKTEDEVIIVSSSRTNSRIEDLPTKVEVLGSEEVGEENGIKPGNIAGILGDIAGIQIQQSSATTGNSDAKVQGLPSKYTQILKDGMPLFGGYSGSFSILQIPPSDLKQIEIIKGASSTLYGGGAIAGMINLISKTPKINKPENAITINQSSLNEFNFNTYFSNRKNKLGYTFFTGFTNQKATDVNKDGLSDLPQLKNVFFHPKIFYYPNNKNILSFGYNLTYEDRKGGDMQVLNNNTNLLHQFFIKNSSTRNSLDAAWDYKLNTNDKIITKTSISFFNRDINSNVFGMGAKQMSYYSEISYNKKLTHHQIVSGINFIGENFTKKIPDSSQFKNYKLNTIGIFIQDDWNITSKIITQTGLRIDNNNIYKYFILPRLSILYKINKALTTRLGGGLGYKIPSNFANEIDERYLGKIYYNDTLVSEKSNGINWDINFKKIINNWHFTINQMFYITKINNAVVNETNNLNFTNSYNATLPLITKGFETYVAATKDELEIYFGYTYTDAKQHFNLLYPNVSLSAKNKFAAIVAYNFSEKCRVGFESSFIGKQYLDNGSTTSPYLLTALMIRYNIKNISFVLNGENLFDYRQTKNENIFYGSITNPTFKQIWAPLDGRVINLSAKISW